MHDAMGAIVNAPGYPLLTHYRVDFEKYDLTYLEAAWHEESRMLWVVRDSGTHLIPLGVHPRLTEQASAVFAMSGAQDYFLLSNKGIRRIDLAHAKGEVSRFHWRLDRDGGIFKGGQRLADIGDVQTCVERVPLPKDADNAPLRFRESQVYDVRLLPRVAASELSLGDMIGLRINSECAAIEAGGSLLIPTRRVRLGETDLSLLMDRERAKLSRAESGPRPSPVAALDLFP